MKLAMLETKQGIEVAEKGRCFEPLQENPGRSYRELHEAIEYMNAKQSSLLATVEPRMTFRGSSSPGFGREDLGGGK